MWRPLHCASLQAGAQLCSLRRLQANVVSVSDSWELTGGPVPSYLSPHHCACRARLCRTLLVGKSLLLAVNTPWSFPKTLAPWKESYDKSRPHIKKQRHHFANKGPYSQSYAFPVVMYKCESWTKQKAERQRIDAFKLWCWRRLLKEIQPVHPKENQS